VRLGTRILAISLLGRVDPADLRGGHRSFRDRTLSTASPVSKRRRSHPQQRPPYHRPMSPVVDCPSPLSVSRVVEGQALELPAIDQARSDPDQPQNVHPCSLGITRGQAGDLPGRWHCAPAVGPPGLDLHQTHLIHMAPTDALHRSQADLQPRICGTSTAPGPSRIGHGLRHGNENTSTNTA
jgi:hypothetical protein